MRNWRSGATKWIAAAMFGAVSLGTVTTAIAADPAGARLAITLDKSRILEVSEAITKISVTNPKIADVLVLSPTSLLINAKGVGTTSLVLFQGQKVSNLDVTVLPTPVEEAHTTGPNPEMRSVVVQRGGNMTTHTFVRETHDPRWLELGVIKPAIEEGTAKK
ncbi:MAG TPA: pilus assembly protein N-terminal domain-containing protein [Candidatus Tectomicrobia bacterium]|nr:pilus assembly protein N-terminal domain-containing protein [Candidatus Tectomicrobia bacterium]